MPSDVAGHRGRIIALYYILPCRIVSYAVLYHVCHAVSYQISTTSYAPWRQGWRHPPAWPSHLPFPLVVTWLLVEVTWLPVEVTRLPVVVTWLLVEVAWLPLVVCWSSLTALDLALAGSLLPWNSCQPLSPSRPGLCTGLSTVREYCQSDALEQLSAPVALDSTLDSQSVHSGWRSA